MELNKKQLNTFMFTLTLITIILFIISKSNFVLNKLGDVLVNARFKTITKNMKTKKLDNITYYYSNKSYETYINDIKKYINDGEAKTVPLLGHTTMYPYNIIMFTTPEAFGKACDVNPKKNGATTVLNSLYIPCANIKLDLFAHEYTHYKIYSLCKEKGIQLSKIPSWFNEGVAEYVSSTLSPDRFKYTRIKNIQDFKNLDKNTQFIIKVGDNQKAYMQSYIAVKKIIQIKGQNAIHEILINSKSMTFDDSFEKVVGLNIDGFQKLLENELKSNDIVDALMKSATTYQQQKKFDKVKDLYLEATKKYPYNELAWHNLSLAYIDLGDFENAKKSREKLISISVDFEKSVDYCYYSQLFITTDLDKAVSLAEKSVQFAKIEKDNSKYYLNYLLLVKNLRDNINLAKPFTQYITLIKSDYIYGNMLKINIINHVLAKYPDKNDSQKEQLIKIKNDLEKQ